ncbi:diacylglycerol/lipid kinase family protein [Parapedobacter sp. DT-150]|uniref:diacylglycerol/lipid kinase family protein n=1 Tax=Parapedobacter sp. DT-150 TaxID=3396162 RepID=UPI003F1BC914
METGKHAYLVHNPKAGDRDHAREDLITAITSCGFTCRYTSAKAKQWERLERKTTLVVVAGGDGTVRRAVKKLLMRRMLDKRLAVALLPMGTANNFAKTLRIPASLSGLRQAVTAWKVKKVDVGAIGNLRGANFFLEGMGFGLLPRLIKEMKEADLSNIQTAEEELDVALNNLIAIAKQYEPKRGRITIDGTVYEGNYLLVEILNIKSVGPNLELASQADPGDGTFHVALLKETDREAFVAYLQNVKESKGGRRSRTPWQLIEASQTITLHCDNKLIHVDDELISINRRQSITVEIRPGVIDFVV